MTPEKHPLPASLTLGRNFSPVSMTPGSEAFPILESFTGVNDTAVEFLTGVTPVQPSFTGVNDTAKF